MNQAEIDAMMQGITNRYGTSEQMQARYAALDIEWHEGCRKHGVVHCTSEAQLQEAHMVLTYFWGSKCDWRSGLDLEFYSNSDVSPQGTRPWHWCGTTMLFASWQREESARRTAAQAFQIGDRVSFTHKGDTREGVVYGIGRTARLAIVTGSGKWYVPATQVTKLTDRSSHRKEEWHEGLVETRRVRLV